MIVLNAEKVAVTGNRLTSKMYYRHSGYPGGLHTMNLQHLLQSHPERAIEFAVRGMLPKNKLGEQMIGKLRVYTGADHPHEGQQPTDISASARCRPRATRVAEVGGVFTYG